MRLLIISTLLLFLFPSFVTMEGKYVDTKDILKSKEKTIVIMSNGLACHQCFIELSDFIQKIQKKNKIRIILVFENTPNLLSALHKKKYLSDLINKNLKIEYYCDDEDNPFLNLYQDIHSPSLLIIENNSVIQIKNEDLFDKYSLSKKAEFTIIQFINKN